jgi:hypothetical protein
LLLLVRDVVEIRRRVRDQRIGPILDLDPAAGPAQNGGQPGHQAGRDDQFALVIANEETFALLVEAEAAPAVGPELPPHDHQLGQEFAPGRMDLRLQAKNPD